MSLPVTRIRERKRAVVGALLKLSEVGLFRWVTKRWMPQLPGQATEGPRFSPAGLAQASVKQK